MSFTIPRWWWTALIVSLVLLALGGTLNAVESGMRDNYATDGCVGPATEDPPEDVDCAGQRLSIGIVDAVSRATFGPGIAMAILAGVYLLGSAIALAWGGPSRENEPPQGGGPA